MTTLTCTVTTPSVIFFFWFFFNDSVITLTALVVTHTSTSHSDIFKTMHLTLKVSVWKPVSKVILSINTFIHRFRRTHFNLPPSLRLHTNCFTAVKHNTEVVTRWRFLLPPFFFSNLSTTVWIKIIAPPKGLKSELWPCSFSSEQYRHITIEINRKKNSLFGATSDCVYYFLSQGKVAMFFFHSPVYVRVFVWEHTVTGNKVLTLKYSIALYIL